MLGLMLFAQGIVAANACDVLTGNVNQAFALSSEEAAEPCHDTATSNANACLDHCTQGDRVSVDQITPAFVIPHIPVLRIELPEESAVSPTYFAASKIAADSGPPVSIRFCSFQI